MPKLRATNWKTTAIRAGWQDAGQSPLQAQPAGFPSPLASAGTVCRSRRLDTKARCYRGSCCSANSPGICRRSSVPSLPPWARRRGPPEERRVAVPQHEVQHPANGVGHRGSEHHEQAHKGCRSGANLQAVPRAGGLRDDLPCSGRAGSGAGVGLAGGRRARPATCSPCGSSLWMPTTAV